MVITGPTEEPLTLDEVKAHCRVVNEADDLLLTALIAAARQYAENECRKALVTQTLEARMDAFPSVIVLDVGPVQSITSVKYLDAAGVERTVAAEDYAFSANEHVAHIYPAAGKDWPSAGDFPSAVRVRYVAGYGGGDVVPEGIKAWMKLRIGALYEHREESTIVSRGTLETLPYVDRMLDPWRATWGFA